jgi:FkbM family methyltransferase
MNKKYLGTTYGGWTIDLDSISDGDTIICGGVGEDTSFEEELLKHKNVKIIEVDPTPKSHKHLQDVKFSHVLIKKAIEKDGGGKVRIYKNSNPNHVSESIDPNHRSVENDYYDVDSVSINRLCESYKPSFIKIDIEGSEYNVYRECLGINQICIEFHHHCISDKSKSDTMEAINFFISNGYYLIDSTNNYNEVTLLKK